jgi:hypothetical protein
MKTKVKDHTPTLKPNPEFCGFRQNSFPKTARKAFLVSGFCISSPQNQTSNIPHPKTQT